MRYHVRSCDRLTGDFLAAGDLVYRNDPFYVRPFDTYLRRVLDPRANPYYRSASLRLFVCYREGRPAARVAVTINPAYGMNGGVARALFGFFESADDRDAVRVLFDEVCRYLRGAGIGRIEGPFNPHHYAELGLQLDGFTVPPTFFQTHNPSFYPDLLEQAGFALMKRIHTRRNGSIADTLKTWRPLRQGQNLTVRHPRTGDLRTELKRIRLVYNEAFSSNWAFLPVSLEEYLFNARFLRHVMDPSLTAIVEDRGEPLGVLQCVPDLNPLLRALHGRYRPVPLTKFFLCRKKIDTLVVFAVGVRPGARARGVTAALFEAFARMAAPYRAVETTWISDENRAVIALAERLGLRPHKTFGIYALEAGR